MAASTASTACELERARALWLRLSPRFAAALATDLAATRLDVTCEPGVVALTDGARRIALGAGFFAADERRRAEIFAHEAVHVAQKRRGARARGQSAPAAALEAQAHRLTARALRGRFVEAPIADGSREPSFWGPAGHYYASLYVMLAAGIDETAAYQRAFFCQMPDQVFEFDAVSAAVDYYQADGPTSVWVPTVGTFRPATPPELIEYQTIKRLKFDGMARYWDEDSFETPASVQRRRTVDWQISTGLHSLTGRRGKDEVEIRAARLLEHKDDNLRFGLALHCFGDAFAHQDKKGDMYKPIKGHGGDGHTPDNCKEHAVNFIHYVARLWEISRKVASRRECVEFSPMLDSLAPLWRMKADGDDDAIQSQHCGMIITAAANNGLGNLGKTYRPQDMPEVYWKTFWPQNPTIISSKTEADRIYKVTRECGAAWAT